MESVVARRAAMPLARPLDANPPITFGARTALNNRAQAHERLGITLIHAEPYDAPARGKMERWWRTLPSRSSTSSGTWRRSTT